MHLCGHSSIKFLWSCDTRAHDSFSLLQLTQCFQNMFFYQFVHSSESIFGRSGKLSQHSSFKCIHIFFQKQVMINKFFQRKVGSYLLSQACCFLARQLFVFFFTFVFFFSSLLFFSLPFSFLSYYHLFIFSPFFSFSL